MNLKNSYYVMRHGESEINADELFVDNSDDGLLKYGLTANGRDQVLTKFKSSNLFGKDIVIYCSDYLRAVESAKIISKDFVKVKALRELQFYLMGERNLEYGFETKQGLGDILLAEETVENIVERISKLVEKIESKFESKTIILITHQDTAEIIQHFFGKYALKLNNSEIIKVN